MTIGWTAVARSDVGLLRELNEDSSYAGQRLFVVADGMGGHAAGEVASAAAVAALTPLDDAQSTDPSDALRKSIEGATRTLREMTDADPELHGMGTTITAALIDGDRLVLAHVGDSRGYLYRDGQLTQLTRDHTLVQQLVDEGRITADEVATHPQRSVVTRAVDGRNVEPDVSVHDIHPGDRLLLCSDGLSGVVRDETIATVLSEGDAASAADKLVELALHAGAPDNVTCVVADAAEVGAAEAARAPAVAPPAAVSRSLHSEEPSRKPATRRSRRGLIALGATVGVLLLTAGIGWAYVHAQYYVGQADGQVAIYRGVSGTLAGMKLSSVESKAPVPVAELAPLEQERVRDGITAGSLDDAKAILERLLATRPTPTPTPSPSPSASGGPTPATPTPSATP